MKLPQRSAVDGREWRLYQVNFTTLEGEFGTFIYALSFEHAAAVVAELRDTARLGGEVVGVVPR